MPWQTLDHGHVTTIQIIKFSSWILWVWTSHSFVSRSFSGVVWDCPFVQVLNLVPRTRGLRTVYSRPRESNTLQQSLTHFRSHELNTMCRFTKSIRIFRTCQLPLKHQVAQHYYDRCAKAPKGKPDCSNATERTNVASFGLCRACCDSGISTGTTRIETRKY